MAKIQNPQNEKGETLATNIRVDALIEDRLEPLEKKVDESFEAITSVDQFIQLEQEIKDSEGSEYYKTNISANVTKSIDDVDGVTDETNKLVTSKVLNTAILNVKSSISKLEDEIKEEINLRTEGDADLWTQFDENFENLSDELNEHVFSASIHVSEEDRELWDKGGNSIITGDTFIDSEKVDTGWKLSLNVQSSITESDSTVPVTKAVKDAIDIVSGTIDNVSVTVADHTIDKDIHVTANDKTQWNQAYNHVSNTIVHVSANDKTQWNQAATDASDAKTKVEYLVFNSNNITVDNKDSLKVVFDSIDTTSTQLVKPLTSLVIGSNMFKDNSNLTKVMTALPNLTYAENMFQNCIALDTVSLSLNSLSNLYNANDMFNGCTNLQHLNGNFSFLYTANNMLSGCQNLTADSMQNLVYSIKDWTGDTEEHIITVPNKFQNSEYVEVLEAKNWNVTFA